MSGDIPCGATPFQPSMELEVANTPFQSTIEADSIHNLGFVMGGNGMDGFFGWNQPSTGMDVASTRFQPSNTMDVASTPKVRSSQDNIKKVYTRKWLSKFRLGLCNAIKTKLFKNATSDDILKIEQYVKEFGQTFDRVRFQSLNPSGPRSIHVNVWKMFNEMMNKMPTCEDFNDFWAKMDEIVDKLDGEDAISSYLCKSYSKHTGKFQTYMEKYVPVPVNVSRGKRRLMEDVSTPMQKLQRLTKLI